MQPLTVGFSHGANPTGNQAKDTGFRLAYTQIFDGDDNEGYDNGVENKANESNIYPDWSHLIVKTLFVERSILFKNSF